MGLAEEERVEGGDGLGGRGRGRGRGGFLHWIGLNLGWLLMRWARAVAFTESHALSRRGAFGCDLGALDLLYIGCIIRINDGLSF